MLVRLVQLMPRELRRLEIRNKPVQLMLLVLGLGILVLRELVMLL